MNIICPICKKKLFKVENTYKCENNHSYDIAKQGYVNLSMQKTQDTGDNPDMINARTNFLSKGYYSFLRDKVNELIDANDTLLDLACGEGYYTSAFKAKEKIGIDLSKQGLKHASKNDLSTTYILSSIFRNPIEDKSMDKIIIIFAPIAKQEIYRILKDDGKFILVKPNVNHLIELKEAIYDNPYLNEIEEIEIDNMIIDSHIEIENKSLLSNSDLKNLFMMTPYIHSTSQKDKDKLELVDELEVTFSFIIDVYKKKI